MAVSETLRFINANLHIDDMELTHHFPDNMSEQLSRSYQARKVSVSPDSPLAEFSVWTINEDNEYLTEFHCQIQSREGKENQVSFYVSIVKEESIESEQDTEKSLNYKKEIKVQVEALLNTSPKTQA
ncbi:hypothetical protein D5018_00120 [Parashewanella curva]|uniref:Uncharacterized protein n=1 Tax=Parashewanella curva TaxID=2338552 RepID=A0A3L8Q255_9GAMM|nr:hypothetical protein [Parashewanella curva]RLV61560.1 hypothetical protein D5018_00120 [Parashewanella curva]